MTWQLRYQHKVNKISYMICVPLTPTHIFGMHIWRWDQKTYCHLFGKHLKKIPQVINNFINVIKKNKTTGFTLAHTDTDTTHGDTIILEKLGYNMKRIRHLIN